MIVDFIPAIFNTWLNITMERLLVDGAVLYVAHNLSRTSTPLMAGFGKQLTDKLV